MLGILNDVVLISPIDTFNNFLDYWSAIFSLLLAYHRLFSVQSKLRLKQEYFNAWEAELVLSLRGVAYFSYFNHIASLLWVFILVNRFLEEGYCAMI